MRLGVKQSAYYFVWACFFGYLLIDDMLGVHEQAGLNLANAMGLEMWMFLRPVDYGEIIYSLAVAIPFLLLIFFAYKRGSTLFKQMSQKIFCLLLFLAFFGVVVDAVHVMTISLSSPFRDYVPGFLRMVEDGGEMMTVSLIFYHCFAQASAIELQRKHYRQRISS